MVRELALAAGGGLKCSVTLSLATSFSLEASFSLSAFLSLAGSLAGSEVALVVPTSTGRAILGALGAMLAWELGWTAIRSAGG